MKVNEVISIRKWCPYCDGEVFYARGDACWRCLGCGEEWGPEEEGWEVEDWEDHI